MPPDDLEDIVDRALKQLPAPRAPRTLAAAGDGGDRSRTRERAPARAPRARPWVTWPLAWQVASIAVAHRTRGGSRKAVAARRVGRSVVRDDARGMRSPNQRHCRRDESTAATVANVTRIVWHALVQPFVGYLLFLILVMCAACATFGAALGRVALGGVPQT